MVNIKDILQQQILVLDGAMGTMLQRYKFQEEDFRGERFKDWEHPLQGNNDLLSLTQPEAIAEVHRKYFAAGADIVQVFDSWAGILPTAQYDQFSPAIYQQPVLTPPPRKPSARLTEAELNFADP